MPESHTVEQAGELLPFLFACHPDVKRTRLRQWLKHGSVHVNGLPVQRTNHPLQAGDVVAIHHGQRAESLTPARLPRTIRLLYEDEALIVIDKPPNLLSMATATEREKTAYALLSDYVRQGRNRNSARVWIVHRLDRETSGLMVFAKTEAAKRTLQAEWQSTEKLYLAVVEGSPPADQGVLRSHLDENATYRVRSAPPSERTRHAVTRYRVVKRSARGTLLEVAPETGRRNQIRVHLADAGCPVIGDQKYGARGNPARRLALHASSLRFVHPLTGEPLKFESPLPGKLARLV